MNQSFMDKSVYMILILKRLKLEFQKHDINKTSKITTRVMAKGNMVNDKY